MKKEWQKKSDNKKDKKGKHVLHSTLAENAAEYLSKEQWGQKEQDLVDTIANDAVILQKLKFNTEPIGINLIHYKKRVAPSPYDS